MAVVIEKQGWLARQQGKQQGTQIGRGWRSKWVVLHGEELKVYSTATERETREEAEETVSMKEVKIETVEQTETPGNKPFAFCIVSTTETTTTNKMYFAADDETERKEWVNVLNHAVTLSIASSITSSLSSRERESESESGKEEEEKDSPIQCSAAITVATGMCCERCEAKMKGVLDQFVSSSSTGQFFEYEIDSAAEIVFIRFRGVERERENTVSKVVDALIEVGFFSNEIPM